MGSLYLWDSQGQKCAGFCCPEIHELHGTSRVARVRYTRVLVCLHVCKYTYLRCASSLPVLSGVCCAHLVSFNFVVFALGGCHHNQTKEMIREETDIAEEKRLAAKIVVQAKAAAPRLATMSAISEHRNRWVAYKVRSKSTIGRAALLPRMPHDRTKTNSSGFRIESMYTSIIAPKC